MSRFRFILCASVAWLIATAASAQNWEVDPSFTLPTLESSSTGDGPQLRLAALPDGRVLVVKSIPILNGRSTGPLVRLNLDGSIDDSFAPPALSGTILPLHVYADGRILVSDASRKIVRLLPTGALDPSFAATDFEGNTVGTAEALSGAIWIWGLFRIGNESFSLGLLRRDGGWDESPSRVFSNRLSVSDAAVQPDGRLVVAGRGTDLNRVVFRLSANGEIDPTFDAPAFPDATTGTVVPSAVAALSNGHIIVASRLGVTRLLASGASDPSFRPPNLTGTLVKRATTSGVMYFATIGPTSVRVQRTDASGALDQGFQLQGDPSAMLRAPFPVSWDDRTLFFANTVTAARIPSRQFVTRANTSGAIDPSFQPRLSNVAAISEVLRQPDGKYLVSGLFDYVGGAHLVAPLRPNLARLNADGSLDPTFRPPPAPVGTPAVYRLVAMLPDGRSLIALGQDVHRVHQDGSVDTTFPVLHNVIGADPAGNVYHRAPGAPIERVPSNGTPDTSFAAPPQANAGTTTLLPRGGYLVETTDGLSARIFTWLREDGSVTGELRLPTTSVGIRTLLPDGSLMFFTNVSTPVIAINAIRIQHYSNTGQFIQVVDVAADIMSVAGVVHRALVARGGGTVALNLLDLRPRGQVLIQDNAFLLRPMLGNAPYAALYPLARVRPKLLAEPVTPLSPTIYLQPTSVNFVPGNSPMFTVGVFGASPYTFQWFRDGVPVGRATEVTANFNSRTISSAQAGDVGNYTVQITNAYGTTISRPARLGMLAPPVMVRMPPPVLNVAPGQTVALTLTTTGDLLRYTYLRNDASFPNPADLGISIPGGTFTLLLPDIGFAQAGVYRIRATDGTRGAESTDTVISVRPGVRRSRLANVSVRTVAGTGDQSLIVGFVIGGEGLSGPALLARAIGPALGAFGVNAALADPQLTLYAGNAVLATNDNWGGDAQMMAAAVQVGAFALADPGSRDAALYRSAVTPAAYTIQVIGAAGSSGVALAELYDASPVGELATRHRLVNLSTRAQIAADGVGLIAGFVIAGELAQTVLVRAVGPSLAQLGVSGYLREGTLVIMDGEGRIVAENLRRGFEGAPDRLAERVGAFPLAGGANDNAIAITLPPGPYTVQVRGAGAESGIALIEVYDVP